MSGLGAGMWNHLGTQVCNCRFDKYLSFVNPAPDNWLTVMELKGCSGKKRAVG